MTFQRLGATAILALGLVPCASFAALAADSPDRIRIAQAETVDVDAAVAAYLQAQADIEAAKNAGGDTTEAQNALESAAAELGQVCELLGMNDIDACIATVLNGQTDQDAVAPPPEPAAEPEPVAQPDPVAEEIPEAEQPAMEPETKAGSLPLVEEPATAVEEPAPAEVPAPAPTAAEDQPVEAISDDESATPAPASVDEPVESEPVVDEPVVDEPTADEPAAEEPTAEEPETVAPGTSEQPMATETGEVNPAGTPIPRDLSLALASYEDANRQLARSVAGTSESEAAQQSVEESLVGIDTICKQNEMPDRDTCLATFGVALSSMATPLTEAPEPEAGQEMEAGQDAPVLDSAKDAEAAGETLAAEPTGAEQAPPPESDADAQAGITSAEVPSIGSDAGMAISEAPARETPAEAIVVEQSGSRIVFQFNNQLFLSNPAESETRLSYGAVDRYVEELPRGRTRETIFRQDGTVLVTVYNRYGDILRRSHIDENGNEIVLAYMPEDYDPAQFEWQDPGQNLPPLRLNIAPEDYVLDADTSSFDELTDFLDSPPVESVQRLYSIDEVKRSARIRDMVRRLEIGNLTFAFGSASIPPDQVGALSIVANAMLELIDENPAETFLIEGHTDAVGTDYANLVLSDERAYTVAITLTEVYGVPPENIATQGYGERYLKVRTEAPERANRRVTIRRITPLVTPVFAG